MRFSVNNRMLRRLEKRCEQSIGEITADMKRQGAIVAHTRDGVLIHKQTGANVLAVCHLDYVPVPYRFDVCGKTGKVFSPRLDDRLGLFVLLDILPAMNINCDLLLTDSEEIGQSTARYFDPESHRYNWMVQFDRRGSDVVLYDYESANDWKTAIHNAGFHIGNGTFSDISALTHLGVCGMNIGTGYHREHSRECFVDFRELFANLALFAEFHRQHSPTKFAHVENTWFDEAYYASFDDEYERGEYRTNKTRLCDYCVNYAIDGDYLCEDCLESLSIKQFGDKSFYRF